jgi:hypothetical protein
VVLGLLTLLIQVIQFGWTSGANLSASREKAWRDAVGGLSFAGDAKSVSAALNLETFFNSKKHAQKAKALTAAVLPSVENERAFDTIFFDLVHATSSKDESIYLYDVINAISVEYRQQVEKSGGAITGNLAVSGQIGPQRLSAALIASHNATELEVKAAERSEYLIDSYSHGLETLCKNRIRLLGATNGPNMRDDILFLDGDDPVDLRECDFRATVFTNSYLYKVDLSKADLTDAHLENANLGRANLNGATLTNAVVTGANLENAQGDLSIWKGVDWWQSALLSSSLCKWLKNPASQAPTPPSDTPIHCVTQQ